MTAKLTRFVDLTVNQLRSWKILYDREPLACPETSPDYVRSMITDKHSEHNVIVWHDRDSFAAFTLQNDTLRAVAPKHPVLNGGKNPVTLMDVCSSVRHHGYNAYFPLADESYIDSCHDENTMFWKRRNNFVIDVLENDKSSFQRALERGSKQILRKRSRLENRGYNLYVAENAEYEIDNMLKIDNHSWKAMRRQSMTQRHQDVMYSKLLKSRFARITFLRYQDEPIAFRLDVHHNRLVTCLKWSFDERHAKVSPGMYLLTTALDLEYGDGKIDLIDLHGGPDSLKKLVCTHEEHRIDLWHGNLQSGEIVRMERLAFDAHAARILQSGKGLRHGY